MNISRKHGFVAVDMLLGIAIIGSISVTLIGLMRREHAIEYQLAASRGAVHLAEHALLNLQHGQFLPSCAAEVRLTVRPATGGTAPAGYVWAKVEATVQGQTRWLLGVVPASSVSSPGGKS